MNQLLWFYAAMESRKCCEIDITAAHPEGSSFNVTSAPISDLNSAYWNEPSGGDCEIRMKFAR